MNKAEPLDTFRPTAILLVALSLSIGWGIRGNFGHEYGAMMPGLLAAVAVCLASGRADWRARVPYFAFFGALGWAFGGSISYMQVISYTHSGHLPSVVYGFLGLFLIGFLWAGMGGAGTAFAAVANREQLTALFRPILWVFGGWAIMNLCWPYFEHFESAHDATWQRHASILYWYDADWIQATTALLSLFAFDLWERRCPLKSWRAPVIGALAGLALGLAAVYAGLSVDIGPASWQPYVSSVVAGALLSLVGAFVATVLARFSILPVLAFGVSGALLGVVTQATFRATGLSSLLWRMLVWHQVDMDYARAQAQLDGIPLEEKLHEFVINWPQFIQDMPDHIGWVVGAALGVCLYFYRFGRFRSGASLLVCQSAGWLLAFILLPTLLGFGGAGLRLTPPRSDDWAGIVGVFVGTMIWLHRNNLIPVFYAALVSGIVGGLGFSGAAFVKLMMLVRGNPQLTDDAGAIASWSHWQHQNWHSFLEQTYGFFNGLAIVIAMGLLARHTGRIDEQQRQRPWTAIFAVATALFGVVFLNAQKSPARWMEVGAVPEQMTMPLFRQLALWGDTIDLTFGTQTWYCAIYAVVALVGILAMVRHRRKPIAMIPDAWLGRGQLLYLVFLWAVVIMNFELALPDFRDGRLITEGVITLNAVVCTWLVLTSMRKDKDVPVIGAMHYEIPLTRAVVALVVSLIIAGFGMTAGVRHYYGDKSVHKGSEQTRFGPDALWRTKPLIKGKKHS